MNPSFYSYDRRDAIKKINRDEQLRWWTKFILWVVIFLLGATLVNIFLPVSNAAEEKDTYIDDKVICSSIHEYPIEQHKAIISYCTGLMNRGL